MRSPDSRWARLQGFPAITGRAACEEFAQAMNCRAIKTPPVVTGGPVWPSAQADGVMIARCFSSRAETPTKQRSLFVKRFWLLSVQT